jgi:hypothetical protein
MASFNPDVLASLSARAAFCRTPTGSATQDSINQDWLAFATSPNSSDVQEKILVEACGGQHKGGKKLGADGGLDGVDLEAKPSKSPKTTSAVNITDDSPERLLKDIQNPHKLIVIGRCPGGLSWKWVLLCRASQFNESRYRGLCKSLKHVDLEPFPVTVEEQVKKVEILVPMRATGTYLRSAQLKFADIKEVVAFWVNPEHPLNSKSRAAEDTVIQRFK